MGEPKLSGPITGGERGWAFGATASDLAAVGYQEEEWFLEGDAPLYDFAPGTTVTADGRWQVEQVGTMPYVTRMMVRRPIDPADANGIVKVGWNNVTAGFDLDVFETDDGRFEPGVTVVGVTVHATAVTGFTEHPMGLRVWDPVRYGSLSIPSDDASYGIFSHAARLVGPRRDGDVDVLGGIEVRHMIATGGSQSAARLLSYLDAVQPIERIFDAFFVLVHWGGGSPLDTGRAGPLPTMLHLGQEPWDYRKFASRFRTDLVPVFVVNSETETTYNTRVRQPDDERFRFWEIAGSSHTSGGGGAASMERRLARDFGASPMGAFTTGTPNDLDARPVFAAAERHLLRWLSDGTPPPGFPPIEVTSDGAGIVRDEHDIARGGIRLPDVAVPLATLTSASPAAGGPGGLSGSRIDFDEATIRKLYRSRDDYLARYDRAVNDAVTAGFVLPADADRLRTIARARALPLD